ncbi:MAG: hypothetical protein WBE24_11205, partial [Candidatus Acidiferrum sp.]
WEIAAGCAAANGHATLLLEDGGAGVGGGDWVQRNGRVRGTEREAAFYRREEIWWMDEKTNKQMVIRPTAQKHDVSRVMGNVFAVKGKMLWAARMEAN